MCVRSSTARNCGLIPTGTTITGFVDANTVTLSSAVGVGTGIAPLRSVWQSLIRRRTEYGKVAIYAGFLTPMHRLLTDELDSLAKHGIDVSVTVDTADDNWDGPIGYVQDALTSDHPAGANAVACLSGMSAMVDACRKTLQNYGFDESRILLNF